jgi:hypothetical protein
MYNSSKIWPIYPCVDGYGRVCIYLSSVICCAAKFIGWNDFGPGILFTKMLATHFLNEYFEKWCIYGVYTGCFRYWWTYHSMNKKLCIGGLGKCCNKEFKGWLKIHCKVYLSFLLLFDSFIYKENGKRYFVNVCSIYWVKGIKDLGTCQDLYSVYLDS